MGFPALGGGETMTRTFIARFLLALAFSCTAFWSASFTSASSDKLEWGVGNQQSASPTPTPVRSGLPVVSPNGSRIAFISNRGGTDDLFVISKDGTEERQLTHTPETESNLAWAENGKQILFSVFKDERSRLYAIDPNGKNQRELANVPGRAPDVVT
jgi:dipeptidyl aminopeptidase/acylaminoacyl peptidase